jgi:RimJ/RimL family protein N-acetyltransferase
MKPIVLRTARLVLDQPTPADADITTEYCQDPLFEKYLTIPWPYVRDDAVGFFVDVVPRSWERETEFTWAIRLDGEFVGMIGFRPHRSDIGFWLGAPFRGNGYMPEAVGGVLDWVFSKGYDSVEWECFLGNEPSAAVARKSGFTFTGEAPSLIPRRDGGHPPAWHGVLHAVDSREPKPGWPT